VIRVHDRDAAAAGDLDEGWIEEARMSRLDRVASGLPPCSGGRSAKKASTSSAANFFNGASCQRIGPSLSPSSSTPLSRKNAIDSPASPRVFRFVTER
jgi:hypothetical protein